MRSLVALEDAKSKCISDKLETHEPPACRSTLSSGEDSSQRFANPSVSLFSLGRSFGSERSLSKKKGLLDSVSRRPCYTHVVAWLTKREKISEPPDWNTLI